MNDFRNRIIRFMQGRYGIDELGRFLFAAGLVTWLLGIIPRLLRFSMIMSFIYFTVSALNTLVYIFAVYRIMSRNIPARAKENERFLRLREKCAPLISRLYGGKEAFEQKQNRARERAREKANRRYGDYSGGYTDYTSASSQDYSSPRSKRFTPGADTGNVYESYNYGGNSYGATRERPKNTSSQNKSQQKYIFRKCPACETKLRLKKVKGKHTTVCPKCKYMFKVRVWF